MINGRSIIVHHATFATPEGGRTLYLTVEEAAAYDSDPDAYVAAYLGLSVAEYSEWLDLRGMPLCGARNRWGSLCRSIIGPMRDINEWRSLHRNDYCHAHGGER